MKPAIQEKKKIEPVSFKLCGADFLIDENLYVHGEFHPIPLELWGAIIGFHRQVSINYGGESVSYHKWHDGNKCYNSLIPYQKTQKHGLSVDVNWQDSRNQKLLDEYGKRFGEDFFPACTIHTHVDVAAFESGTDAKDEAENPGWHITLGKLISHDRYDLDFRMRFPQTKKLKAIMNTGAKLNLKVGNFFSSPKDNLDFIETTPGYTDWLHLLNRIEE